MSDAYLCALFFSHYSGVDATTGVNTSWRDDGLRALRHRVAHDCAACAGERLDIQQAMAGSLTCTIATKLVFLRPH
jgi:hypothetical protein